MITSKQQLYSLPVIEATFWNAKQTMGNNRILNSRPFLSAKPVNIAVALAFCSLTAGVAQAACVGLNTASVACTGTDTGNKTSTFGGDQTIQATDWTLTGGNLYIRDGGSPGTLSFTGDNVNITYGGTTNGALTAYSASGNAKLKLNSGTITSTGSNAYGLYAAAANASGTATIDNAATINTSGSVRMVSMQPLSTAQPISPIPARFTPPQPTAALPMVFTPKPAAMVIPQLPTTPISP